MKNSALTVTILVLLAGASFLAQGCYTQLALNDDERPSYERDYGQNAGTDSTVAPYENDQWYPHQYVGFQYYHPSWCYGNAYDPYYQDPWYYSGWGIGWGGGWWGPPIVSYYFADRYYSPYWGYRGWNTYHSIAAGGHYASRPTGYRRTGGMIRSDYGGFNRSGTGGSASPGGYQTSGGMNRGGTSSPLPSGSRRVDSQTPRTVPPGAASRAPSNNATPTRRPDVQQPRHRDAVNVPGWFGGNRRSGTTHSNAPAQNNGNSGERRGSSSPGVSQPSRPSAPAPAPSRPASPPSSERRESGGERSPRR
jgi:hypothetical protein